MSGPPETFMLEAGAVAAAYALADGKTVIARWDTPDEAWATREDVPRCGTVYVVKGPRPTDDDEGDPRAHDTPEQAINDLAQRRAPAPKPDELTVAEYVLASTAAAEREAAERRNFDRTTDAIAENVSLRTEAEALRRERVALAARVQKLRTALGTVRDELCGDDCQTIDEAIALDDAQAAKGVE